MHALQPQLVIRDKRLSGTTGRREHRFYFRRRIRRCFGHWRGDHGWHVLGRFDIIDAFLQPVSVIFVPRQSAQCLQRHVDPVTGKESFVFSCFDQDQHLDRVDFTNLRARLRQNTVLEKLSNLWLTRVLAQENRGTIGA